MKDVKVINRLCAVLDAHKKLKHPDVEQLKRDFHRQSDREFEDFLLEEGLVTKPDLLEALGEVYKQPAIDVEGIFFEHHLVRMFPKDVMLRHGFIPYQVDEDVMMVIASEPDDAMIPVIAEKYVSYDVTCFLGLKRDIDDAIKEFFDKSLTYDYEYEKDNDDEPE